MHFTWKITGSGRSAYIRVVNFPFCYQSILEMYEFMKVNLEIWLVSVWVFNITVTLLWEEQRLPGQKVKNSISKRTTVCGIFSFYIHHKWKHFLIGMKWLNYSWSLTSPHADVKSHLWCVHVVYVLYSQIAGEWDMGKDIPISYSRLLVWIIAEDAELVYPLVKHGNSTVTCLSWKAWRTVKWPE